MWLPRGGFPTGSTTPTTVSTIQNGPLRKGSCFAQLVCSSPSNWLIVLLKIAKGRWDSREAHRRNSFNAPFSAVLFHYGFHLWAYKKNMQCFLKKHYQLFLKKVEGSAKAKNVFNLRWKCIQLIVKPSETQIANEERTHGMIFRALI